MPIHYIALSLSRVRLFAAYSLTLCLTIACQAPLSIGILQEIMLEWFAISPSRGSS